MYNILRVIVFYDRPFKWSAAAAQQQSWISYSNGNSVCKHTAPFPKRMLLLLPPDVVSHDRHLFILYKGEIGCDLREHIRCFEYWRIGERPCRHTVPVPTLVPYYTKTPVWMIWKYLTCLFVYIFLKNLPHIHKCQMNTFRDFFDYY